MDAWATLQASGHAQAFCNGCHAISELGNALDAAGGINVVDHERYYDVQCENCHGPGLAHVENPDFGPAQPAAMLAVDDVTGCGECHQGTHHPYVEQWAESAHGLVPSLSHVGTNAACLPCHEGKAALTAKFGETADYVEKSQAAGMPITCGVCHDPHGSGFEANLRADITVPTLDNFCVKCHARSGVPPSARGPHAAQGFLVLSDNVGWIPPGFAETFGEPVVTSHGRPESNPRLCVTCHVARFDVTDQLTGDFLLTSVGHSFEAIPCLDPVTGLPDGRTDCPATERFFGHAGATLEEGGCATSTCHSNNPDAARSAYLVVLTRLNDLLDDIWEDVNGNSVLDTFPVDRGVLPQALAATWPDTSVLDPRDKLITAAEGTLYNAQLAFTSDRTHFSSGRVYVGIAGTALGGITFSAHATSGNGVHNPFLLEALLRFSIRAVEDEYGLLPGLQTDLSVQAIPPPGVIAR
jgi:predicted CXXCH cytochrome family protein